MNFKIGDRVKVYGPAIKANGGVLSVHLETYVVVDFHEYKELSIELRDKLNAIYFVHPKQLRKLKKKEYKSVWLKFLPNGVLEDIAPTKPPLMGYTEFREVNYKKK